MTPEREPKTGAVTSRSAVVAALLLAAVIFVAAIVLQGCDSGAGDAPGSDNEFEGRLAPTRLVEGVLG